MRTFLRTHLGNYPRLVHNNPSHAGYLVVNWFLGNVCNYACSYCPEGLHDSSKPWVDLDVIKSFVLRVRRHYRKQEKFVFEFTGGEVTLFPQFLEMIAFLKENNCQVGIISNGSRALQFWRKVRPYIDQICLSFHPESAKPEHFLEVAKYLSETIRVHMNFMMKPEKFYECYEVALKAKDIPNVFIALQPLIVDFGTELFPYSPIQKTILDKQRQTLARFIPRDREFISYRGAMAEEHADGTRERKDAHRIIASGENSWKGWRCNAGIEQLVVNADGMIFRGWCYEGGAIGHVADPDIRFPKDAVLCSRDFCHCNFDIMSTKFKPRRSRA